MTELHSIVAAGVSDLFPFVVFVIIVIAQMIKKAQREGSGRAGRTSAAPPSGAGPRQQTPQKTQARSADEELRKFLEALGGVPQVGPQTPAPGPAAEAARPRRAPPPPPLPKPKPRKPQRVAARVAIEQARKPDASPVTRDHAPVHQPAQPAGVAGVAGVAHVSDWGKRRRAKRSSLRARTLIGDRKSLAKAVLLREILGPPVALRRNELPRK